MRAFGAICPHSGGLPAEEFETEAENIREARDKFWRMCVGSRYVARIYENDGGQWVKVWEEGKPIPQD